MSPVMLSVRISIRTSCTTLCEQVCQEFATGRWFSPVSSTNKTDRHDIIKILLKVALDTIKQTNKPNVEIDGIKKNTEKTNLRTRLTFIDNICLRGKN